MRRSAGFLHRIGRGVSWFSTIRPGSGLLLPAGAPVLLLLAGCALPPYQPALLFLPGRSPGRALRDAVEPVHTFFPRIRVLKENLLLTDWIPLPGEPYPCRARAEILARPVEGGTLLEIAVQRSRLKTALLSEPAWVTDGGDRRLEEKLRRVLEAHLGGRPVRPVGPFAPGRRGSRPVRDPAGGPRRRPASPGSG